MKAEEILYPIISEAVKGDRTLNSMPRSAVTILLPNIMAFREMTEINGYKIMMGWENKIVIFTEAHCKKISIKKYFKLQFKLSKLSK